MGEIPKLYFQEVFTMNEETKVIEEATTEQQKGLTKKEKLKLFLQKAKPVLKAASLIGAVGVGIVAKAIYDDKKYGDLKPRWYTGWTPDEHVPQKTAVFAEGPSLRELKKNPNATGCCRITFDEDEFDKTFPED